MTILIVVVEVVVFNALFSSASCFASCRNILPFHFIFPSFLVSRRIAYHVAGLLTKNCYKIIYSKVSCYSEFHDYIYLFIFIYFIYCFIFSRDFTCY